MAELMAAVKSKEPVAGQRPDHPNLSLQPNHPNGKGKGPATSYTYKQYNIHAALIELIQQKHDVLGF